METYSRFTFDATSGSVVANTMLLPSNGVISSGGVSIFSPPGNGVYSGFEVRVAAHSYQSSSPSPPVGNGYLAGTSQLYLFCTSRTDATAAAGLNFDAYFYCTAYPASGEILQLVGGIYYGWSGVGITPDGRFCIAGGNATGNVASQSSANVVPLNAWFRVKTQIAAVNGGWDGTKTSIFTGANLNTNTPTVTLSGSVGQGGFITIGQAFGTTRPLYVDDLCIGLEGSQVSRPAPTYPLAYGALVNR